MNESQPRTGARQMFRNIAPKLGNLTRELYQMCISQMGAAAQVHTAALVMDRLAGTHVVPTTNPQ